MTVCKVEKVRRMEGFVELSAALKCGCYVLEYRGIVIYVGKSVKPFARLAQHLNAYKRSRLGKQAPVKGILFDRVWFKQCMLGELDDLERELIAKWRPRYNEVAGPVERRRLDIRVNGRAYTLNPDAPASPRMFDGLRRI